jgi:hypothetical protein
MIWSFLMSKLGKMVASALAVLSLVGAIFVAGRRDAKKDRKVADLQDYVDTQERINEVTVNTDVSAARRRLRKYGKLRD